LASPNALGCFLIGDFVSLRELFEDIKELRVQTGVGEPCPLDI
jgi:hypothetical protein